MNYVRSFGALALASFQFLSSGIAQGFEHTLASWTSGKFTAVRKACAEQLQALSKN